MINLYRVVQEALTNIINHSRATKVSISVKRVKKTLMVIIKDNGHGFKNNRRNNKSPQGLGLSTMGERTNLLKGIFEIKSQIGKGTTVNVAIPIQVRRKKCGKV
jgi:signal transduction histidine kinase